MDLLEYMRSQNDMTQAEWERTFEEEAKEILVLLAGGSGAGKMNGFWDVSHYFIAYVDCQTGALHTGDGRIVYPVSDEESDAGGILDRFRREAVYRLKARKRIPHKIPEGVTASSQNQFLIVEVLEEDAGGVWVFRTVCFERVVLSSPGCLWPGRMDDHEEVLEAHA